MAYPALTSGINDLQALEYKVMGSVYSFKDFLTFTFLLLPFILFCLFGCYMCRPVIMFCKIKLTTRKKKRIPVTEMVMVSPPSEAPHTPTAYEVLGSPPPIAGSKATQNDIGAIDIIFTTILVAACIAIVLILCMFGFMVNSATQLFILKQQYPELMVTLMQLACWMLFGYVRHLLVIFPAVRYLPIMAYARTTLIVIPLISYTGWYCVLCWGIWHNPSEFVLNIHFMPIFNVLCTVHSVITLGIAFALLVSFQNVCCRRSMHTNVRFSHLRPLFVHSIASQLFLSLCSLFPYALALCRYIKHLTSLSLLYNIPLLLISLFATLVIAFTTVFRSGSEKVPKSFYLVCLSAVVAVNVTFGRFITLLDKIDMNTILSLALFYAVDIAAHTFDKIFISSKVSINMVLLQTACHVSSLLFIPAVQYFIATREGYATFLSDMITLLLFQFICALVVPLIMLHAHGPISKEEQKEIVINMKFYLYLIPVLCLVIYSCVVGYAAVFQTGLHFTKWKSIDLSVA